MNKDQYWHQVIKHRPDFQAGPAATMSLTVLEIRNLVKEAFEAGVKSAPKPDIGKNLFDTLFKTPK